MTEVDRSAHRVCGWPDWLRQPHTKWSRHKKWRAIARPSLKQLLSAQICMRKVRLLGLAADTVGILRDVLVLSMHAHAPAWGSRACTWASNQRRQSELHRQEPLEFSSPAIPDALVLWSLLWPGLWPSLGLIAQFRQTPAQIVEQPQEDHLSLVQVTHITHHNTQTKGQALQARTHITARASRWQVSTASSCEAVPVRRRGCCIPCKRYCRPLRPAPANEAAQSVTPSNPRVRPARAHHQPK